MRYGSGSAAILIQFIHWRRALVSSENGDSNEASARFLEPEQPVALASANRVEAADGRRHGEPRPGSDGLVALAVQDGVVSAADFEVERMLRNGGDRPSGGLRLALYRLSGGVRLG